jgi:hypothetical protein
MQEGEMLEAATRDQDSARRSNSSAQQWILINYFRTEAL